MNTPVKAAVGAAVAGLVLLLPGCGGSSSVYPANVQSNYLNACESGGGSVAKCGCTLDWFQKHISLTQFQADEDEVNNGSVPDDMKSAVRACK
jgi:hypothetical protein